VQEHGTDKVPAGERELEEGEHEACMRVAVVDKVVHCKGGGLPGTRMHTTAERTRASFEIDALSHQ